MKEGRVGREGRMVREGMVVKEGRVVREGDRFGREGVVVKEVGTQDAEMIATTRSNVWQGFVQDRRGRGT